MILTKRFEKNTKGRDFFVGDLHGEYAAFEEVISLDKVGPDDRVFCVGDLIDRGPDSDRCLNLLKEPWFFSVVGNHEELMMGSHGTRIWDYNGGDWHYNFAEPILDTWKQDIVEKMPYTITVETEFGTIGVVHAESTDDWEDNGIGSRELNTWARTRIKDVTNLFPPIKNIDIVVVGHTPVKKPTLRGNVLYIDTGATYGNYLTFLSAEEVFNLVAKLSA